MSARYTQFPGVVCQRIRNLMSERTEAEASRKKLFGARDTARDDALRCKDATEAQFKWAAFGRAVSEIEVLLKRIKWCNDELEKSVSKADEPGLFDNAELQIPDFTAPAEKPDEGGVSDEGDEEPGDGEADDRPVGRPDAQPGGLKLVFPGRYHITPVAIKGRQKVEIVVGDREALDAAIERAVGNDKFTFDAGSGAVTRDNRLLLSVYCVGDADVAPPEVNGVEQAEAKPHADAKPKPPSKKTRGKSKAAK